MIYCILGWVLAAAGFVAFTLYLVKTSGWKIVLETYLTMIGCFAFLALVAWLISHCPHCGG
jgi:hypothetical protein